MAIFSRYSSGGMSGDTLAQRRTALRGLRRPSSSPQRPPAAAGVNVDERRTALQTLRAQKGAAPGVQPQAPVTPARASPANTAQPAGGKSSVNALQQGSGQLTGPTTSPSPLKGAGTVGRTLGPGPPKLPNPTTPAPAPPSPLKGEADRQVIIDEKQSNLDRIKANEENRDRQEGQDVTRRGQNPVVGAGQDAQDGKLDGEDTFNPLDLDDVRKQQAEDERLLNQEWLTRIAEGRADAENRAALGGFGLSGAAAGLVGDTETKGARERGQAISDLRKGQREELNQAAIDAANNIDAEYALKQDINQDGKIGTGDPEDDPTRLDKVDDYIGRLDTFDYGNWDENTEAGSRNEPYAVTNAKQQELSKLGVRMTPIGERIPGPSWGHPGWQIYIDQEGRHYIVLRDDETGYQRGN